MVLDGDGHHGFVGKVTQKKPSLFAQDAASISLQEKPTDYRS
jgi:hypothetical protein